MCYFGPAHVPRGPVAWGPHGLVVLVHAVSVASQNASGLGILARSDNPAAQPQPQKDQRRQRYLDFLEIPTFFSTIHSHLTKDGF